jgi:hypothetical protein
MAAEGDEDFRHLRGLDPKKVEFLKEFAELGYRQVLTDRDKLRTRADWMFGIIAAALGFLGKELFEMKPALEFRFVFLTVEIALLAVAIFTLTAKCILPRKYGAIGGVSPGLLKESYIQQDLPDMIVGYLLTNLSVALTHNQSENENMAKWIHRVAIAVVASPLLAALITLVIPCMVKSLRD